MVSRAGCHTTSLLDMDLNGRSCEYSHDRSVKAGFAWPVGSDGAVGRIGVPKTFTWWKGRPASNQAGFSLTWILFVSVVLVMVLVFVAVQILGIIPDDGTLSFEQRMDFGRLVSEIAENLPLFIMWIMLMMSGILLALRLGMRSLRQISERASEIGPATISQRLPLHKTPREIAPLVVAFNSALDRLEAGLRAQRDFSSNAAHELRTPLATLRAQVENALEPEERAGVMEEFDRLGRLIAQLLALAEADNGEDLRKVPFDLVAVARATTSEMAGTILAEGCDIAFETSPERWDCYGAPGLVELAIRNLLENAVRHTHQGCKIIVSVSSEGHLRVSDNGPGIPQAFEKRLFHRFSKADARGFGAGLGLSIISRVMSAHHGDVRLDPAPVGARFVLDFSRCSERQ